MAAITRRGGAVAQCALGRLERGAERDRSLGAPPRLYTRASWRDGASVAGRVGAAFGKVAAGAPRAWAARGLRPPTGLL